MLYAIVFICGSALMGLEFVAARVLAPALGTSLFVWGAVISIVMVALSLGYWLGGEIADRLGAGRMMAPMIALAGVLTALAPVFASAVLPWASDLGPRLGSLAAASAIFFLPALALATISPMGVRLATTSAKEGLAHVGRSAGGLYAISTAGSIAGTLLTAFWLIPLLSLEPLIVGIGYVLLGTALLALLLPRLTHERASAFVTRAATPTTFVLAILGLALGSWVLASVAPPGSVNEFGERILLRLDSQYHRISVTEDDVARHLRFDRSHQSAMDLANHYESRIRYPDYTHLALALKPDAKRVLVMGLGGGTITKRYWRDYPQLSVDTVEIDPAVVNVARKYFDVTEDDRSRIFTEDARRFIQRTDETYDIVIIDAYYADSLPFHLTTDEFFREVKERLAPDGVVAYNTLGSVTGERSKLFRSMHRTVGNVFSSVWSFPIGWGSDHDDEANRNIIVLATDSGASEAELRERIANRVEGRVTVTDFPAFEGDLYTEPVNSADVPLLTDSHAPTDSLIEVN